MLIEPIGLTTTATCSNNENQDKKHRKTSHHGASRYRHNGPFHRSSLRSDVTGTGQHLIEHLGGQATGEGVLLTYMVGAQQHPSVSHFHFDAMAELWQSGDVVALGEMGLDYHYDFADRTKQGDVFAGQLRRAADFDKPIVIHCRDAMEDCVPILLDHGFADRRVVFHCFTARVGSRPPARSARWR